MSSDVFIISSVHDPSPAAAIRAAVELAGVSPSQLEDAVFGLDGISTLPDLDAIARAGGLVSPSAGVSSSLRALFFLSASILSGDTYLAVVSGLQPDGCTALVMASPEAVGRLNLLPRARLAARSLAGAEPALRVAGLASADIEVCKEGEHAAALLHELLDELDARPARWGTVTVKEATMIVERL